MVDGTAATDVGAEAAALTALDEDLATAGNASDDIAVSLCEARRAAAGDVDLNVVDRAGHDFGDSRQLDLEVSICVTNVGGSNELADSDSSAKRHLDGDSELAPHVDLLAVHVHNAVDEACAAHVDAADETSARDDDATAAKGTKSAPIRLLLPATLDEGKIARNPERRTGSLQLGLGLQLLITIDCDLHVTAVVRLDVHVCQHLAKQDIGDSESLAAGGGVTEARRCTGSCELRAAVGAEASLGGVLEVTVVASLGSHCSSSSEDANRNTRLGFSL